MVPFIFFTSSSTCALNSGKTPDTIAVSVQDGQMHLVTTPCLAMSLAMVRVRAMTPVLDTVYPTISSPNPGVSPAMEATLMICPLLGDFLILSMAISVPIMTDIMFTTMHFFQPKLVLIPALFTRMSTHDTLKNSSALLNRFLNCSSLVTSQATKHTFPSPNLSFSSAKVFSPVSCLRSERQTLAPAFSRRTAKALPNP